MPIDVNYWVNEITPTDILASLAGIFFVLYLRNKYKAQPPQGRERRRYVTEIPAKLLIEKDLPD